MRFHRDTSTPATPISDQSPWRDTLGRAGVRSAQVLLALSLATVVVFALIQLKLVVIPVLIALIIAAAAAPLLGWLTRRGLTRAAATWVALLGGIVIFGGIIWLIVFTVQNQFEELAIAASDGLDQLQEFLAGPPFSISEAQIDDARTSLVDFATSSQFGTGALAGVSFVGELLTGTVLALVILFYFLKDGPRIWEFFLRPFRGHRLTRGQRIGSTTVRVLGDYVRGTAIIAFVDAAGIGIGVAIVGVPLALPLAIIVFIGAFIPLVGATAAGILAALVALVAKGPVEALIVIGIVIVVNQLEGNFLQPVVMGQSLNLHPLVILVALTAGTILGGITGAVLSVPIAAVGWSIIKVWNPGPSVVGAGKPSERTSARAGESRTSK